MSGISKFQSYCLVICIALLLVEELGELTIFARNLPTLPYFLVGLVLPSLLTTKPSVSLSLPNVELRLHGCFQRHELVVVCKGLTRNHMMKLTAQFYADDLCFNQLIAHSEHADNGLVDAPLKKRNSCCGTAQDKLFCQAINKWLLGNSAFIDAHEKLQRYVVAGAQPALKFLEQFRVLSTRNLVTSDNAFDAIDSIPRFDNVCENEWYLYVR